MTKKTKTAPTGEPVTLYFVEKNYGKPPKISSVEAVKAGPKTFITTSEWSWRDAGRRILTSDVDRDTTAPYFRSNWSSLFFTTDALARTSYCLHLREEARRLALESAEALADAEYLEGLEDLKPANEGDYE